MPQKPDYLEAQKMSFLDLARTCVLDLGNHLVKLISICLGLIALSVFLFYQGRDVLDSITGFLNWITNAQLQEIFASIGNLLITLGNNYVWLLTETYRLVSTYDPFGFYIMLEPCKSITEGTVQTFICSGTPYAHNYLGWALTSFWVAMPVLVLFAAFLFFVTKGESSYTSHAREFFGIENLTSVIIAGVYLWGFFLGWYILAGLMSIPLVELFKLLDSPGFVLEERFMPAFLLAPALFVVIPFVFLRMIMQMSLYKTQESFMNQLRDRVEEKAAMLSYSPNWSVITKRLSETITEHSWAPWLRFAMVTLGAVLFLWLLALGTSLMPNNVGLSISAVFAFCVVALLVASVVTCYPLINKAKLAEAESILQRKIEAAPTEDNGNAAW